MTSWLILSRPWQKSNNLYKKSIAGAMLFLWAEYRCFSESAGSFFFEKQTGNGIMEAENSLRPCFREGQNEEKLCRFFIGE